jgi:hypothetical protein
MKCEECSLNAKLLTILLDSFIKKSAWKNHKNALAELQKEDGLYRFTFGCDKCGTEWEIIINKVKHNDKYVQ